MTKQKKNRINTVTTFSKLLVMVLFILFPFIGFYLGMRYGIVENKKPQPIAPSQISSPSKPAKLVEEFYSQYINCLNNNFGASKTISGDCDSLITTKYFTQEAIDSLSGRSKAYCGYEPPGGVYVTESENNNYKAKINNYAEVILWGEFAQDKPTIIQLKQGLVNSKVYQDWQIDKIVCL